MDTIWQAVPSTLGGMGTSAILLLLLLAALLIAAAVGDVRTRLIPNRLTLAVALLAPAWWIAAGYSGHDMLLQIALSAGVLTVFAACFALGMMGGGDVKLLAALALWLPLVRMAQLLVWMALAGGVLTLAMLIAHRLRKSQGRLEIPYGVAISAAALLIVANEILTVPGT